MTYILFICLLLILGVDYCVNNKDVLCPSFIFTLSLTFSVFWACIFTKKWELYLHANTFIVIAGGAMLFSFSSLLIKHLYKKNSLKFGLHQNRIIYERKTNRLIKICFLLFSLYTCYLTIETLTRWANLPFSGFIAAGKAYDQLKFNTIQTYNLPSKLSFYRLVTDCGGYYFAYSFVNELIENKKFAVIDISIFLISVFSSTLTGARSNAVYLLLAFLFFTLFVFQKRKERDDILTFKLFVSIVILVFLLLLSFPLIGKLLQRSISSGMIEYLAIYIGAEIKNLDIFLQKRITDNTVWGSQTFIFLIRSFGKRLGFQNINYNLDLPFQRINGNNLGNVYTVFYPFIYDFGYGGWMLLSSFMGILSQAIYEFSKHSTSKRISLIFTLIYGHLFSSLVLAFFSNKFFEENFTVGWAKKIVVWIILDCVLNITQKKRERTKNILVLDKTAQEA